jgi:sec-independent protein translocase protein TatA
MFENVGGGEIILILLVILIFFGPKKIPELASSLGKGLRKFNDAKTGLESQVKAAMKEPLDAITGAKSGFESKLREIAEPLQAELKMPHVKPGAPPSFPTPESTMARGSIGTIGGGPSETPDAMAGETPAVDSAKVARDSPGPDAHEIPGKEA